MEWLGPALELARSGSPFVAGGTFVLALAAFHIREIRRHHAAEIAQWNERCADYLERFTTLQARDDTHLASWLEAERRYSELVRVSRQAVKEAGPPS